MKEPRVTDAGASAMLARARQIEAEAERLLDAAGVPHPPRRRKGGHLDRQTLVERRIAAAGSDAPVPLAASRLLVEARGLCWQVALAYDWLARLHARRYLDRDEALQVARLGLLDATVRYRPPGSVRSWLCTKLRYWLAEQLPRHVLGRKVAKVLSEIADLDAAGFDDQVIAGVLGVELRTLRRYRMYAALSRPLALDAPIEGEETLHLGDVLSAPEPEVDDGERLALVMQRLDALPERLRLVLRLRYGLSGASPLKLRDVGVQLGVSESRACQLERQALRRLRGAR